MVAPSALREGYDAGQVCLNGHPITAYAVRMPQFTQKHCGKCGAMTITNCPACDEPIRGGYWGGALVASAYEPSAYCLNCGEPYPWTAAGLEALKTLAEEDENLTDRDREELAGSLGDIVTDTPVRNWPRADSSGLWGRSARGPERRCERSPWTSPARRRGKRSSAPDPRP